MYIYGNVFRSSTNSWYKYKTNFHLTKSIDAFLVRLFDRTEFLYIIINGNNIDDNVQCNLFHYFTYYLCDKLTDRQPNWDDHLYATQHMYKQGHTHFICIDISYIFVYKIRFYLSEKVFTGFNEKYLSSFNVFIMCACVCVCVNVWRSEM